MEKKLRRLFDFQDYARNAELQSVIDSVHARYSARELSDDEADMVAAAGLPETAFLRKKPQEEKE